LAAPDSVFCADADTNVHSGNYSMMAVDELYWLCREAPSLASLQNEQRTTGSKRTDVKRTFDNPPFDCIVKIIEGMNTK
jgi:hypothetical protein